jgi:hypothetical protein
VSTLFEDLLILYQVNNSVLKKVLEWCEHHKNEPTTSADEYSNSRKKTTDIKEWDQKFMQADQETQWCEQHKDDPSPIDYNDFYSHAKSTEIAEWDQNFMPVNLDELFEIILVGP